MNVFRNHLLLVIFLTLSFSATADPVADITNAIKLPEESFNLQGAELKEILSLKSQGYINQEPNDSFNYDNLYLVKKPINMFGGKVVAVLHQYIDVWLGCCVNPGITLVIEHPKDYEATNYHKYADENKCGIQSLKKSQLIKNKEWSELITSKAKAESLSLLICNYGSSENSRKN